MSRHHIYEMIKIVTKDNIAGKYINWLIQAKPLRTRHKPAFEARIGQGLCSTRWKGLNLFIILFDFCSI